MKKYQNKKWLEDKYVKEKFSIRQIAEICNITYESMRKWMIKFNIPRRYINEAVHLAKVNHCKLSQEAIEWINGELLGDGSLNCRSLYSARFDYSSKYEEYIQYVSDILKSFGIKQSGKIRKFKNNYKYISYSYEELLPIYKQWYPNNKKIVPKDIELTSLTCRQWYIGDGYLKHPQKGTQYIRLSTDGFPQKDVSWLVKELSKIGFKATRQPSSNRIVISVFSTKKFLNYIGNCPVKCYQYKWAY